MAIEKNIPVGNYLPKLFYDRTIKEVARILINLINYSFS
jgi:hypothetical protein